MTKRWMMSLLASLYFLYESVQINMINTISFYLKDSLLLNFNQVSIISSAYLYGSLFLLLPAGYLIDRFNPKKVLLISFAFSILGTFVFAFSDSWHGIFYGRMLAGFSGGPFCLVSVLHLVSGWFADDDFPFAVGVIVAIGSLGGIFSQLPMAFFINSFGINKVLFLNALLGLVFIGLIALFLEQNDTNEKNHEKVSMNNIKAIRPILLGVGAGLLNIPIFVLGALWGNYYLHIAHEIDFSHASTISMMIYVGMMSGAPFWGGLAKRLRCTLSCSLMGAVVCFFSIQALYFTGHNFFHLCLLFFLIGFSCSAQILSYSAVAKINCKNYIAFGEALVTWFILLIGGIGQQLAGMVINGKKNQVIYSFNELIDFNLLMVMLSICFYVILACIEIKVNKKNIFL